jgi:hypothetical protein
LRQDVSQLKGMALDEIRALLLNLCEQQREEPTHTRPRPSRLKITGEAEDARPGLGYLFQSILKPATSREAGSGLYNHDLWQGTAGPGLIHK